VYQPAAPVINPVHTFVTPNPYAATTVYQPTYPAPIIAPTIYAMPTPVASPFDPYNPGGSPVVTPNPYNPGGSTVVTPNPYSPYQHTTVYQPAAPVVNPVHTFVTPNPYAATTVYQPAYPAPIVAPTIYAMPQPVVSPMMHQCMFCRQIFQKPPTPMFGRPFCGQINQAGATVTTYATPTFY